MPRNCEGTEQLRNKLVYVTSIGAFKNDSPYRLQGGNQELSKDHAGNDLSGTDGQHHERNHIRDSVSITQNKRDNEGICENRR